MTEYIPKSQMDFCPSRGGAWYTTLFISAFWPRGACKATALVHQTKHAPKMAAITVLSACFLFWPMLNHAYMAHSTVPLLSTWFITPFGGLHGELDDAPRMALEGADVGRTTWKAAAG